MFLELIFAMTYIMYVYFYLDGKSITDTPNDFFKIIYMYVYPNSATESTGLRFREFIFNTCHF